MAEEYPFISQWQRSMRGRSPSPVGEDGLQRRYEVRHHHVDALQVGAEEGGGVEDDGGQHRPADEVRDLEALDENHVEPATYTGGREGERPFSAASDWS